MIFQDIWLIGLDALCTLSLTSLLFYYAFRDAFIDYWVKNNMITMDMATQIFSILKQPDQKYLTQVRFLSSVIFPVSG